MPYICFRASFSIENCLNCHQTHFDAVQQVGMCCSYTHWIQSFLTHRWSQIGFISTQSWKRSFTRGCCCQNEECIYPRLHKQTRKFLHVGYINCLEPCKKQYRKSYTQFYVVANKFWKICQNYNHEDSKHLGGPNALWPTLLKYWVGHGPPSPTLFRPYGVTCNSTVTISHTGYRHVKCISWYWLLVAGLQGRSRAARWTTAVLRRRYESAELWRQYAAARVRY